MEIEKETCNNDRADGVVASSDATASESGNTATTHGNVGIRTTVENAEKDGVITDKAYWQAVLSGEKRPKPEWLKLVMDRYHVKLLKR